MAYGVCARCKERKACKFRQPGTWVVECDRFEEDPEVGGLDPASNRLPPSGARSSDPSAPTDSTAH